MKVVLRSRLLFGSDLERLLDEGSVQEGRGVEAHEEG